jgi:zinc transporter 6
MAGQTNSMALQAFCSLCLFDLLFISTALISAWNIENRNTKVRQKFQPISNENSTAFFIPTQTIITFLMHLIVIYFVPNQSFDHVIAASSSSWLQEHVSDIFQNLCHYIPGLSRLLLPRINPLALLCWCGLAIVFSDSFLLKMNYGNFVDTLSSLLMAFMTFGTMVPMAIYSGKILLQTTPAPMIGQLDKCLHEASRLDGVLEFRHEHFWALSFGTLVGSLHVRCR